MSTEDDALALLRELVAGADDHRCWHIPNEVAGRIRALVEVADEAHVCQPPAEPTANRLWECACGCRFLWCKWMVNRKVREGWWGQ